MRETHTFTVGDEVLLFGKTPARVTAISSNRKSVQVTKDGVGEPLGEPTWTRADNVRPA
jgi:hypothetical protein